MKYSLQRVVWLTLVGLHIGETSTAGWNNRGWNQGNRFVRTERQPCPEVTDISTALKYNCVSKYECKDVCTFEKLCTTRYEYKCTDYRRQECKSSWQNQCNGNSARSQRRPRSAFQTLTRRKRLIPTEVVYDQSFPLFQSDLPLADPSGGQRFEFSSPPLSKTCWLKVQTCEWVKYRSSCRNLPVKTCDDFATEVCKNRCERVYQCETCPDNGGLTVTTTTTAKPEVPGPPAPPPSGTFIIGPPAPPSSFDDILIDARRNAYYP